MQEPLVRLSDIIITPRIPERKSRGYRFGFHEAHQRLGERLEQHDANLLQAICDCALKYCMAETAGMSLLGNVGTEPMFNWQVVSGKASEMAGNIHSPFNTPCGTVLEMFSYQVFRHPERHYAWARENGFVVPEMICLPIYTEDMQPFGTFWLLHGEGDYFEQEDIRILNLLTSLIHKALRKPFYRDMLTFS